VANLTATTANIDIDYVNKDFASAEDAMINFATIQFGPGTSSNRLWTDYNIDSFSRVWLELVAFMADCFYFYFDVQATQAYLQTATVQSAVNNIAAQFGFTPSTAQSASGVVTFTTNGAGTIPGLDSPSGPFIVSSTSGQQFFLVNSIVASAAGTYSGSVLQGAIVNQTFSATGLQNETFNLSGANVVVDLLESNALADSPQVSVTGNPYTLVSTFIYSDGTNTAADVDATGDIIGGGGQVFELNYTAAGVPYIEFGDGTFGRQLLPGETVNINYRTGGGSAGNVGAQTVTTLVSSNPIVTAVTNPAAFSGGADAQTIAQLVQLIPASLRTLERAVTEQDYDDLLLANFPQVQDVSTAPNTTAAGIDLNVYVVPAGSTITPISANQSLLTTLSNFLDIRKMVTVQFQILDAYAIDVLISLEIHLNNTSSQSSIMTSVTNAIEGFFSLTTGGTAGAGIGFQAEVLIENIEAIMATIAGIDRFEIRKFTYRPRIAQYVQGLTTTYTSSNVEVYPNVGEYEWLIADTGPMTVQSGVVVFNNTAHATYTYTSSTGQVQYTSSLGTENLNSVSPGDLLVDGNGNTFDILYVNAQTNTLYITEGFNQYNFVVTSANATAGAVYSNNGQNFTVNSTIVAGTALSCTITTTGTPTSSGTLTKVSGTGDATITFSSETGTTINTTSGGSIKTGGINNDGFPVSFESFTVYRKINLVSTNLSVGSITDTNTDFSVLSGIGSSLAPNILLDNTNVFIPNQYVGFYLVDSSSNIWLINSNDSDTITTALTATNDASISTVAAGAYNIVTNYSGYQIVFNNNIFIVDFNDTNTVYAPYSQFSNIGTIGDAFQLSKKQNNLGSLGVALDLISYNPATQTIQLNNQPDLSGINANDFLIDSSGQIFRIVSVDNRIQPSISYDSSHYNSSLILAGSGTDSKVAQGFKVPTTTTYPVVSWYLTRTGNVAGNVIAQIVNDNGSGLPNLASVVATSIPVGVASSQEAFGTVETVDAVHNIITLTNTAVGLSNVTPGMNFYDTGSFIGIVTAVNPGLYQVTLTQVTGVSPGDPITINSPSSTIVDSSSPTDLNGFSEVVFTFVTPPALTAGVQYHLVLYGDGTYTASQRNNVLVYNNNTAGSYYVYTPSNGSIQYTPAPGGLTSVLPGNFIEDIAGHLFEIVSVNPSGGTVTIAPNQAFSNDATSTFTVNPANATVGAVYSNNSQTFTVVNTIVGGTTLVCTSSGLSAASGTLVKVSGTGDSTIVFTSVVVSYSGTTNSGSIFADDNVYVGFDNGASSPTPVYSNGVFELYNGVSWSDYPPTFPPYTTTTAAAIFSVEGPNAITVMSNLTPVLGVGATVSSRYYDDNDEVSFILGLSSGIDTYAADANALGYGTVNGTPNQPVDYFIFRTSPYIDDIINLRPDEIPQLLPTDLNLKIYGGIS
jgi:hypothetical protein